MMINIIHLNISAFGNFGMTMLRILNKEQEMWDKMPDSLAHSDRWKQIKITMDNDSSYINPGDFLIILSTPGETPTKI